MSFQSASQPYKNTLELQNILMDEARKADASGAVKAQIARAFGELEKLKRVMRGLPANTSQSIKSEPKQKRARVSGPVEPVEVEPIKQVDKIPDRAPEPTPAKPLLAQAEEVDKSKDTK